MGHNSRKLTQVNKAHKGKSKSKAEIKKPKLKINKKKLVNDSKELRLLKADQHRKHSLKLNADSDYSKRGDNDSAPLLCGIFPLFDFNDIEVVFSLLKSTDQDAIIKPIDELPHYKKFNCENFIMKSKKFKKNFAFTACRNFRDRFDYLDLAKVVDWCLFILPNDFDELIGDYTEDLISSLIAQGMPSSCFITLNNSHDFKMKDECKYLESIIKISLGEDRIQCLNNFNDANKLMRHLSQNCKPSFNATKRSGIPKKTIKEKRGYFLVQNMNFNEELKEMRVTGCMRGFGIDLMKTKFLHLTEVGDFSIKGVDWISPIETNRINENMNFNTLKHYELEKNNEIELQESDNDEEMNEDSEIETENEDEEEEDSEMEEEDSEMEEEVSDIGSYDSDNDPNSDKMSFATTAHSGYSIAQIMKFKQSRENSMFPDEVEVAYNESAMEKFKKYRGLQNFKSVWPVNTDLPACYEKIHHFRKYKHERNRLCNLLNKIDKINQENFILPGSKFEIILENFPIRALKQLENLVKLNPTRHLIGSGLFYHEERISVLHFNERRIAAVDDSVVNALAKLSQSNDSAIECGEDATSCYDNIDENYNLKPAAEPIESKETMLFQVGFRRFTSTPIYSEFTATSDEPGDKGKSKLYKFMELKKNVVATVYGPITYGPTSVLQFRIRQIDLGMGELGRPYVAEMVATGSLLSIDSSKPIIKRILLTGQIYKVNKRSVMIRYMFFNTRDIEHFKVVPLHVKGTNISGRIVSSHGSHGYMKCRFEKPIGQDEVVCMALYKRVFPKYTVENMYDHLPNAEQMESEDQATLDVMDKLF